MAEGLEVSWLETNPSSSKIQLIGIHGHTASHFRNGNGAGPQCSRSRLPPESAESYSLQVPLGTGLYEAVEEKETISDPQDIFEEDDLSDVAVTPAKSMRNRRRALLFVLTAFMMGCIGGYSLSWVFVSKYVCYHYYI